ncbi:MAG TPA: hypothetical protein VK897_02370 [Anaerolineales bacterium]|nr:hypothetical protein [Anaerolineales bacterium]
MVLSDIFRKFTKKEPAQVYNTPSSADHLGRARQAALEFLSILEGQLAASDGSLHAGTMLAAAAWLTGTSLYRSFNFKEDSPSGTVIKSNEVNASWEGLIYLLEQHTFKKADIPIGYLILSSMGARDFRQPQVEMLYVQSELQARYNAVMKKHGFGYLDGARAGIVLCSLLIQQYHAAKIIDLEPAAGIVAEKILEAAKTVPPALKH